MLAARGVRDYRRGACGCDAFAVREEFALDSAAGEHGDLDCSVAPLISLLWVGARLHQHLPRLRGDGGRRDVQGRRAVGGGGCEAGAAGHEGFGRVGGVPARRSVQGPHARAVFRLQARGGAVLEEHMQGLGGIVLGCQV